MANYAFEKIETEIKNNNFEWDELLANHKYKVNNRVYRFGRTK